MYYLAFSFSQIRRVKKAMKGEVGCFGIANLLAGHSLVVLICAFKPRFGGAAAFFATTPGYCRVESPF
jgi:hypothetical protein